MPLVLTLAAVLIAVAVLCISRPRTAAPDASEIDDAAFAPSIGSAALGAAAGRRRAAESPAHAYAAAFREVAEALQLDVTTLSTPLTFERLYSKGSAVSLAAALRRYVRALDAYDALDSAAAAAAAAAADAAAAAALQGDGGGGAAAAETALGAEAERARRQVRAVHAALFPWLRRAWGDPLALRRSYVGRGIVVLAGDRELPWALTHVRHLRRRLGCALPIEVFHCGARDLQREHAALLEAERGVAVLDLGAAVDARLAPLLPPRQQRGAAAPPPPRALALLASSFAEVILMDADTIFLSDPAALFDTPQYAQTGTLFYQDRAMAASPSGDAARQHWLRMLLLLAPAADDDHSADAQAAGMQAARAWRHGAAPPRGMAAGVAVYDKRRRFRGALAAAAAGCGTLRPHLYARARGDAELFWLAHEIVGEPYAFSAHAPAIVGPLPAAAGALPGGGAAVTATAAAAAVTPDSYSVCAEQALHLTEGGAPLWLSGWLLARNRYALRETVRRREAPDWQTIEWWAAEPGEWYSGGGGGGSDSGSTTDSEGSGGGSGDGGGGGDGDALPCFAFPADRLPRRLSADALDALQQIRDDFMALFMAPA
ncbi:mannosyltransferase putative-domain-containing protein [Tribonema minus]|uniref:Mannosyltransferase putative-domain-containing protein n=1 Tax=Tribonema minus TaxID=303371 RepID=A0A835ZKV8_9STRA|nr:mannosyltransferase putative-domain-containing protein [Tribonema minus]